MLAKNLQGVKVSAAEGAEYAQIVQKQLREERNDDEYDLFWNGVVTDQVLYNVSEPATTGRIFLKASCLKSCSTALFIMRPTTT